MRSRSIQPARALSSTGRSGNGGGIYFVGRDANTLTIRGCTVRDNTGDTNGGGGWVVGGANPTSGAVTVTVSNSAFLRNNATTLRPVGGLHLAGGAGSIFTLTNTTFADNVSGLGSAGEGEPNGRQMEIL